MKNVITIVTLMVFIGTASLVSAAPPEIGKGHELREKIQSDRPDSSPAPQPNLIGYLQKVEKETTARQNELNNLLKAKGYLIGTKEAVKVQELLTISVENIKKLRTDQSLLKGIAQNLGQIPLYLQALKKMHPPDSFPSKCYTYRGKEVVGIITYVNGKLRFHYMPYGTNDYAEFLDPITDVGLLGNGKEVVVSVTPQGMLEKGYLSNDRKVVCLSLPFKHTFSSAGKLPPRLHSQK